MCYTIDSENILLNYFRHSDSNEISFKELRTIRKKIEENLENSVYVDITYNSIRDAVKLHQDIFNMELTKISIVSPEIKQLEESFIENKYNYKIPANIKERYLSALSKLEVLNEQEK
jgi:hypothetical protein